MYGRTRGRFDIIGEVGAAKGVFGFEIDASGARPDSDSRTLTDAAELASSGGDQAVRSAAGTIGLFDLNTDSEANIEVKWLYVEFPLPLVPFSTIVRLGAQPFATAANYKLATYANGDFAGVNLYTTFSPTFKLQTTYVAVDENLQARSRKLSNATGRLNNRWQTTRHARIRRGMKLRVHQQP